MPIQFTVLMPVYDRDDINVLFKRAVESVYNNTVLPNAFIIVVDGPVGSVLEKQIMDFEHAYNLQVIWLAENVGIDNALNIGLDEVTTEWVVRVDADDFNLPNRFEEQVKLMSQKLDLIGGAIQEVDREGRKLAIRRTATSDIEIKKFAKYRNPFNHMTVAFRVDLARKCGGYPSIYLKEDYALWALMIKHGASTANTPEILVEATTGRDMYRRRGGWKYAVSEIALQTHLVNCGIKGKFEAFVHGIARASVFLVSQHLRGWIYENLLREKSSN